MPVYDRRFLADEVECKRDHRNPNNHPQIAAEAPRALLLRFAASIRTD